MEICENISLAQHSTMGVGGDARYFVQVYSEDDLIEAIRWSRCKSLSFYILGNGSNVLFPDEGFNGLVIHNAIKHYRVEETKVWIGSGYMINTAIMQLMKDGLCGFENMFGVPGTLGGAVFQNASAYGHEISTYLVHARVYNIEADIMQVWNRADFAFGYRVSRVKREIGKYCITEIHFDFPQDDVQAIKSRIEKVNGERNIRPKGKSVGSFFKNPSGNFSAGQLIEKAGLKNKKIGGAYVSPIHANYLMNDGNASCRDILDLAAIIEADVQAQFGVQLEREVRLVCDNLQ